MYRSNQITPIVVLLCIAQFCPMHAGNKQPGPVSLNQLYASDIARIKKALDDGLDPQECDGFGQSQPMLAAKYNNLPALKLLVDRGFRCSDIEATVDSPMFWACIRKNSEMVGFLELVHDFYLASKSKTTFAETEFAKKHLADKTTVGEKVASIWQLLKWVPVDFANQVKAWNSKRLITNNLCSFFVPDMSKLPKVTVAYTGKKSTCKYIDMIVKVEK